MSWGASTDGKGIEKGAIFGLTGSPQGAPSGIDQYYYDHLQAAQDAAYTLARVIGGEDDLVSVSLSGHANINHQPDPAWADEFITVSVYFKRRPVNDSGS